MSGYYLVVAVFKYTASIFNIFFYFWAKVVYAIGRMAGRLYFSVMKGVIGVSNVYA
jgi:hypothetical protein